MIVAEVMGIVKPGDRSAAEAGADEDLTGLASAVRLFWLEAGMECRGRDGV